MKKEWWLTEVRIKKDWWLATGVTLTTIAAALGLIRWFAPQLLGIPIDLQMVQVSERVEPFFENVFRKEHRNPNAFQLKDPYTNVRSVPLLSDDGSVGPHDLLGFRNQQITNNPEIITIGDSQTYGNGVRLADNWPSQLAGMMRRKPSSVYNMSAGGWGAVQYLDMFDKAIIFKPRIIIVAFYTGNDPDETVSMVYAVDRWASLRPENRPDLNDRPRFPGFPVPASEMWRVIFSDRTAVIFTPSLRLVSNDNKHTTVRLGYQIMSEVARRMDVTARDHNVRLIFTVIPTKELVYAARMQRDRVPLLPEYKTLVNREQENISRFASAIRQLKNSEYVDLVVSLQNSCLIDTKLYPAGPDGHPREPGHRVIAKSIEAVIRKHLVQ